MDLEPGRLSPPQAGSPPDAVLQGNFIYEVATPDEARLDRPFGDLYRASNPTREQEGTIEIIPGIVRRFHQLGGAVGLGTDRSIGIGMEAGMPLGEMEMLLAAGLTPMEVIEAGTRHSAQVCGHGSELGTLEPGMLADVTVVDGDPLEDLKAMSEVVLVIKNGEIVVISEEMTHSGE